MNLLIEILKEFLPHLYRGALLIFYRFFGYHQSILTYTEDEFNIPKLLGITGTSVNKKIKWRWRIIPLKFSRKSEGWKREKWSVEDLTPYCTKSGVYSDRRDAKITDKCDTEITFEMERPKQRLDNLQKDPENQTESLICTDCGDEIFDYDKNDKYLNISEYKKPLTIEAKNQIERQLRRRTE